jgi:hypothetical protein
LAAFSSTLALDRVRSSGASLVLAVASEKVSSTLPPCGSVAVTLTSRLPTSSLPGVPAKVRVAASKLSQAGSAEPSASVAE